MITQQAILTWLQSQYRLRGQSLLRKNAINELVKALQNKKQMQDNPELLSALQEVLGPITQRKQVELNQVIATAYKNRGDAAFPYCQKYLKTPVQNTVLQ